jgi:hypothetical protein
MKLSRVIASITVLAALLYGARLAFLSDADETYRQLHPSHQYSVTFKNNLNRGYIWINRRVIVHIWQEDADASYDPEQTVLGTLQLQAPKSHTGFILRGNESVTGTLTLPAEFQLNKYTRNNDKLSFAVLLLINDIYPGTEDFRPSPQQNFGAAFFGVKTRESPAFSEVLFSYPQGK